MLISSRMLAQKVKGSVSANTDNKFNNKFFINEFNFNFL